ncbi:hypothetical protein FE697_007835 [Mumia zhuanghuii]|uniref:Uncharacterized protein n=2 Tax=Mumia TaxID=1546255 RepID=A0ABW1QKZ0_9ACTN|nr:MULTISPECIES: hypothetical protein [Mumia]KAA1423504.1 hypothetical protein FE697_007835 [Mumia zhuanghuii]
MSGTSSSDDEEFERIVAGLELSVPEPEPLPDREPPAETPGAADPGDLLAQHGVFQPRWSDPVPPEEEDEWGDDDFVPPDPGPLPRGDRLTRLAWGALLGVPGLLFVLAISGAPVPGVVPALAVVGFVVALVVLLVRRGDHDRGEDPDHGAVL